MKLTFDSTDVYPAKKDSAIFTNRGNLSFCHWYILVDECQIIISPAEREALVTTAAGIVVLLDNREFGVETSVTISALEQPIGRRLLFITNIYINNHMSYIWRVVAHISQTLNASSSTFCSVKKKTFSQNKQYLIC